MRGGYFVGTRSAKTGSVEAGFVGIKRASVLRQAGIAMLAIHFTWASCTTTYCAMAHGDHGDHVHDGQQCSVDPSHEQSIIIFGKKSADDKEPVQAETKTSLQPIANASEPKSSEPEPELAKPIAVAMVPTLANPFRGQDATPVVEDESPKVELPKEELPMEELPRVELPKVESPKDEPSPSLSLSDFDRAPQAKKQPSSGLRVMGEIEVASFNGITPGISNRINVLRTWGDPQSEDSQASELTYRFDDLPAVDVRFRGNKVESILVKLAKPTRSAKLTRKLKLQKLRPVTLMDAVGNAIEQVYPERGVVLRYATQERGVAIASDDPFDTAAGINSDTNPRIGSILIQTIQAEPFLFRAEANAMHHFTNATADLEAALRLERNLGPARAMLSEVYLKTGKAVTAENYAAEAVEIEPRNTRYRLQWAKCLRQLARYDRAVEEVQQVLETTNLSPLVRAQALNEMGLLASLGSHKVARRAMPLHSKAIEIADGLATGDNSIVRLPAKQLLVEAHLAVAVEISVGDWQQKDESVAQWIERASALAEALIAEDRSYLPLRLQVAVSSLAAAANLEEPINPLLWIEEAEETATEIKAGSFDTLAANQFDWQLGLAYFHGSQIEHRRSRPNSAIRLGEMAEKQLAELAKGRDEMPDTAYLMGRLYFQVGAVHAVHFEDHAVACEWYDEAVDRLLTPVPVTTMAAPQQHGDALVSMGVSYWNQGKQERAIEVTEAGVELIEQAVDSGLLESETLVVSYSNLSAMHGAQGEEEIAIRYERLAQEITGVKELQRR